MKIIMSNYSSNLGTRIIGKDIFNDISKKIDNKEKVELDFSGVEIISDSCADEIFTKLIDKYTFDTFKAFTTFSNYNPFVGKIILGKINYAINK